MDNTIKPVYTERFPLIKEVVSSYGKLTVSEYLDVILEEAEHSSALCPEILAKDDISREVEEYVVPIAGENIARRCGEQIRRQNVLLTSNHHIPEHYDDVIQANFHYGELLSRFGFSEKICPIFTSCNISMKFKEFPRGMQIFCHSDMDNNNNPMRIPFCPSRGTMLSVSPPWKRERVIQTLNEIERHVENGKLEPHIAAAAKELTYNCFLCEETLQQSDYLHQVSEANRHMGKICFRDDRLEHIYIPAEEIISRILIRELMDESSLTYNLLFSSARNMLLQRLNGITGCWNLDHTGGSVLFWGVNERKRRTNMFLYEEPSGPVLKSWEISKHPMVVPFEPDSIIKGLEEKRLVPGIFLLLMHLGLLRDYTVLGGSRQQSYYPMMAQGFADVLSEMPKYSHAAPYVRRKISPYFTGPLTCIGRSGEKTFHLGPVEIIAERAHEMLRQGMKLTVAESIENHFRFYDI